MKLRFTPRAIANLVEIADYIHARDPAAARRVRAAIYESLQNLILFPQVGRKQNVEGIRKFVTRKYPYSSITPSMNRRRNRDSKREASCTQARTRRRMIGADRVTATRRQVDLSA
jgi:plasmid stabilization system protein ParE